MKLQIFTFFIISLFFIQCKADEKECLDTVTQSFFPNKVNQKLFDTITGKILQFRDSLGNKLDFNVGLPSNHPTKFFYKDPCVIHDWEGFGDHYSIYQPIIYLTPINSAIFISYILTFQLDEVYPDPVGAEILIICITDTTHLCNYAMAELTPIGSSQILHNAPQNTYVGNLILNLKKDLSDKLGQNRIFQNVWKSAYNIIPLSNNYHIQESKELKLYSKSNEVIPYEFYFNNTHGLIAFRFKDGKFWMQYGSF